MFVKDGLRFNIHSSQTFGGIRYNNFTDPALRAKFGITEIPDPERGDDDYNYNQEIDYAPYLIVTPKSAEQCAEVRWSKIKAHRDSMTVNGGCKVGTHWFHSDTHSKLQQLALMVVGAALPAGIQWKTMDGSFVAMTPVLAQQLFLAQMAQEQSIFAVAEAKKVDQTPIAEGWPEVFVP